MNREPLLANFHAELGLKRLNRTWAKCEIVLGLFGMGMGNIVATWSMVQTNRGLSLE